MMGLAWKSLESRIRRDPDFRRQMIETYRKAFRDNPHLGEEFDVFLMKLGIQAEVLLGLWEGGYARSRR